jgi:hypothetical protein
MCNDKKLIQRKMPWLAQKLAYMSVIWLQPQPQWSQQQ